MMQRGRKSSSAMTVTGTVNADLTPLTVPPGLSDAERGVWLDLVGSKPLDWFGLEHVPIMVEYVRHVCRSHVIDEQMRAFDADLLATDDGLKRYERLNGVATKIAGVIKTMATSMRLTHHAVYLKTKAGMGPNNAVGRAKLWQRDQPPV